MALHNKPETPPPADAVQGLAAPGASAVMPAATSPARFQAACDPLGRPPGMSELAFANPGWGRWRHGLAAGRGPREKAAKAYRFARRVLEVGAEKAQASVLDRLDAMRAQPDPILRLEEGADPMRDARSVAVFVQYSGSGELTAMVRRQIETYKALGFAVVVVSNSPHFPEASWQEARRVAALVVHRRNRHLDFGAWKDLVPLVLARWTGLDELLLANDSVLGPIQPLEPYFATMRAEGQGFFGMLESIQGGAHLQSWLVLARGAKAIGDLADFLAALRLSRSKWSIVQQGELRLALAMRKAGNRVAAIYGYEAIVDRALDDAAERAYLERAIPGWFDCSLELPRREVLINRPLNPAHHLWRALATKSAFPFLKTELIRRNPGGLPDVAGWPALVPADSPTPVDELKAHLRALGP